MSDSSALVPLLSDVADDLHQAVTDEATEDHLGPFDSESRASIFVVLLEISNALACCESEVQGNERESRSRMLQACQNPWARHYLQCLHPLISIERLRPGVEISPSSMQDANLRLMRWTRPPEG